MDIIAKRLRGLREQGGYSQQRLSKTLNIPQSSLFRYESGETEPSTSALLKYANFFQVSLDYIFGRTDDTCGIAFSYRPKGNASDPETEQFIEMCFDPKSPMNARLKNALKQMMQEAKE